MADGRQPTHLIAVDPAALDRILEKLSSIEAKLDAVQMTPQPTWLPIRDFAARIGRSADTVRRRINRGELETRIEAGVTLVRTSDPS